MWQLVNNISIVSVTFTCIRTQPDLVLPVAAHRGPGRSPRGHNQMTHIPAFVRALAQIHMPAMITFIHALHNSVYVRRVDLLPPPPPQRCVMNSSVLLPQLVALAWRGAQKVHL